MQIFLYRCVCETDLVQQTYLGNMTTWSQILFCYFGGFQRDCISYCQGILPSLHFQSILAGVVPGWAVSGFQKCLGNTENIEGPKQMLMKCLIPGLIYLFVFLLFQSTTLKFSDGSLFGCKPGPFFPHRLAKNCWGS